MRKHFLILREQIKVNDAETRSDGIEIALGFRVLLLGAGVTVTDAHGEVERQD